MDIFYTVIFVIVFVIIALLPIYVGRWVVKINFKKFLTIAFAVLLLLCLIALGIGIYFTSQNYPTEVIRAILTMPASVLEWILIIFIAYKISHRKNKAVVSLSIENSVKSSATHMASNDLSRTCLSKIRLLGHLKWKNLIKIHGSRFSIVMVVLLLLGGCFYWFQYRPANIRQECSWVKMHSDLVPEVTQEQADRDNAKCKALSDGNNIFDKYFICDEKPSPAIPANDWYRKASSKEYSFCIHEHGL